MGAERFAVDLPEGIRLDVDHRERFISLINPAGPIDIIGIGRIEGIGETIAVRLLSGGAKGFQCGQSGHGGLIEADGTINGSEKRSGSGGPIPGRSRRRRRTGKWLLGTVRHRLRGAYLMSYDFLGKGLRYPFRFQSVSGGTQVSTATSREHEHIRESILQILGTRIGERFMNPEFGSRLKDLVFEQNDEVLKGLLRHYVIDAIKRWEKRVIITEVRFDDRPLNIDGNLLLVHIAYRDGPEPGGRQRSIPFYREDPEQSRAQLSPAGTRAGTAAGSQRAPCRRTCARCSICSGSTRPR